MKTIFGKLRPEAWKKGTSLIEVLTAITIFSIMIAVMMSVFVTMLHKRSELRDMQKQTEEMANAMQYIAKKVRTGRQIPLGGTSTQYQLICDMHGGGCSEIKFLNNSDGSTEKFTFAGSSLKERVDTRDEISLLTFEVEGSFHVMHQNDSGTLVPLVTIQMNAKDHPETSVQTTVSMRSY